MKTKTIAAAESLEIHPAQLLLHFARLDRSLTFDDVWPEVDEAWVETIRSQHWDKFHPHAAITKAQSPIEQNSTPRLPVVSRDAMRVLDKLHRQGKWGHVAVSSEALANLTHLSAKALGAAIVELRREGLLDHDGTGRGTVSLSSARKKEIELFVQTDVTRVQR